MKTPTKIVLAAVVVAGGWATLHWPRINDVETGRTPEYPDLQPREYAAPPEKVEKAARAAIEALPRWTFVGAGSGPGGREIQAEAATRVFRFKDDVNIRIRREGGRSKVSVRSKSRIGTADYGQNARNISTFLAELDRQLAGPSPPPR